MNPYQNLANAIVVQAAKDYRLVLHKQEQHPSDKRIQKTVREYEAFFRSAWYEMLTDVKPEYLLRRLRERGRAS